MTFEDEKPIEVENVGFIDSIVRGSISIAIVVAVMWMPSITAFTLFALTQLAIYAGLTAFIGWDPIYALIKRPVSSVPEQASATLASYTQREARHVSSDHKQAA
jgi:hypothetical protein